MQILPMVLVPRAVSCGIPHFRLGRIGGKEPSRAFLHHVVEAIYDAVRGAAPCDKGILCREDRQLFGGIGGTCDVFRHIRAKFVRESHNG